MAIDPEMLNEKQLDAPVRTGVYLNHHRESCVLIRFKNGHCTYLTWQNGTVRMVTELLYVFTRDWPIRLPNYPALRALRKYRDGGLPIETTAAGALRAVLGGGA